MPTRDKDASASADRAEAAGDRAEAAEERAEHAEAGAQAAERAAEVSEHAAEVSEHAAELSEQAAEVAQGLAEEFADKTHTAAEAMGLLPDENPLTDPNIHEFAAGVDAEHPFGEVGEPMNHRSPFVIAFVATLGVLLAVVFAMAVRRVSDVLVLIVIAAFLAIGLNPAVTFLQRRGLKRGLAAAVVMGGVLLFFAGFVAAAVPPIVRQAAAFREQLPQRLETLRNENETFKRWDKQFKIEDKITSIVKKQGDTAPAKAVDLAIGVFTVIGKTLTVLILTLYFLGSYDRIKRGALRLVPRTRRPRVGLLTDEILARVGGYVLGNLATSLVAGVVSGMWFAALGVPYAFALAMLVAIFDLIPLVGATIAAVVCTAIAFFVSPAVGIATLVFFIAYQQFENYILVPRVMKATVDVSPLATILAALIGGTLLGALGAVLAVPTAAAISLIGSEVVHPRQDNS
ncbi:MAG: AI-2E family transporter [Mycobacteriales bacterium]